MNGLLTEFLARTKIGARRRILRASRKLLAARLPPISHGFFDRYPQFYSSSVTYPYPNRLNQRYRACIEWNEATIRGKLVLDLASHDGRWSFAALKAGATHVVGIEARDHLVQAARSNLRAYGIPEDSFQFILGDVFVNIDRLETHSIDTVFCFGFFYHVGNHMLLLSKIARLKPKYIILDTFIALDPRSVIVMCKEDVEIEGHAVRVGPNASGHTVVGRPSKAALELMLSSFGWSFVYYDWNAANIRRWDNIEDYYEGQSVTLRINCAP
jgi:hypothetical protein